MSKSREKSVARFNRRNRLATAKGRPRQFLTTPFGQKAIGLFLEDLADFLAGKREEKPHDAPRFLRPLIRELDDYPFLALVALSSLWDAIKRGWDRDDPSVDMKFKLKIGNELYERLYRKSEVTSEWTEGQRLQVGDWLVRQVMALDLFDQDADGFPCISEKWKPEIDRLHEEMIWADPVHMPHLKEPPPWAGWWLNYDDRLRAKFVRDWRPETKAAITEAFQDPQWEHARGVNALKKVPLRIDTEMIPLVERFAVEVMGRTGDKRKNDQITVDADVADAKWCGDRTIWLDYSCDRRGRVYALQHLNFAREDHVRAFFKFSNGVPIDPAGTYWLEVHCANCEGSTDKESPDDRSKWAGDNRHIIKAIAENPLNTFDLWKSADSPLCYVAACRELAAAWADPDNFVTHLPIGFDGSANGIQHLALLAGDLDAARMTNLYDVSENGKPRDVYGEVIAQIRLLLEADPHGHAQWWRDCFDSLNQKQIRKLLKQPIMTYAYSVTLRGATRQAANVYYSFRKNSEPPDGAFKYLAEKTIEACGEKLPGPAKIMDYIQYLARHCTDEKRFLKWTSQTGFPVENRYQVSNVKTINCYQGSVRVRHDVADGATELIDATKASHAAAPNFIHSLDAAHLIKTVLAAVREGIEDILTVHDCYYCLAPQGGHFKEIILGELFNLYKDIYKGSDPLAELRNQNVSDPSNSDQLPVPPKGALKDGLWWALDPESVKFAKPAFG
jgi:DNA-directed RNA polymerase